MGSMTGWPAARVRCGGTASHSAEGDARPAMLESMSPAILIGSVLVTVAIFTSVLSFRIGAPLLLIFLLLGLGAGENGPGGIVFDNAPAAYFIGSIALALILFDSGFGTNVQTLRVAAAPAIVLSTVGVVLTTVLVASVAHLMLDVEWLEALLLGAIVSSTDAAAVFFLLRAGGITLRERVRATLEIESSSNDPMAIFLTIALVQLIAADAGAERATLELITEFVLQLGLGAVFGLGGGIAITRIIDRTDLEPGLYPIIFLSLGLALFSLTSIAHGSGFLAVYIAGIVAGNARMRHGPALRRFSHALTWLSQIAMFLTLGLLATPAEFGRVGIPGIVLALFLMFVARPLAVWLCLLPFRFTREEITFVAWVGLRGAVSILLAIVPIIGGLAVGRDFFNIAFIVVLASLLVQGWSIRIVARWLRLIVPARHGPVDRIELELPGRGDHEIVAYKVHAESRVAKGERIPRWARPSLILRDGVSLRPDTAGRPRAGDQIYIITSSNYVSLLDRLFAGPAEGAADASLYGEFALDPDARLGDVADIYGVAVPAGERGASLRDYIARALAGDVEEGDRVSLGEVDLIVRAASDTHAIEEVGLGLAATPPAKHRLPLFQGRREIADWLKARRAAKRQRQQGETPPPAAEHAGGLPSAAATASAALPLAVQTGGSPGHGADATAPAVAEGRAASNVSEPVNTS